MCEQHHYIEPTRERSVPREVMTGEAPTPTVTPVRPPARPTGINISRTTPRLSYVHHAPDDNPTIPQKSTKEAVETVLTPPAIAAKSPGVRIAETVVKRKPAEVNQSTRSAVEHAMARNPQEEALHEILMRKFAEFRAQEAAFPQGKDKRHQRQAAKANMLFLMQRALRMNFLPPDQAKAARTIKNQLKNRLSPSMTEEEIDALLPNFILELLSK